MLTPPVPTSPLRSPAGPGRPGGAGAEDADLLERYGLPALAPEEALRGLSRVAAALCGVPTAVVNLLGSCVQHQVAAVGFPAGPSPRAESLCSLSAADPRLRHVPDAAVEPAFAASAWVDGRLGQVRFYASAPLVLPDGQVLGSLCVFDDRPHHLDQRQRDALADLAAHAVALLEGVREAREAERRAALFRLVAEGSADVLSRYRPDGTVLYVSPSVRAVLGHDPAGEVGSAATARVHPEDRPALQAAMRRVLDEDVAQVVDLPAAGSAAPETDPVPAPRAAPAVEHVPAPRPTAPLRSRRARVLVADDSDLNLLIVQGLLEDHADVATVTDGDEAVEAVRDAAAAGTPFDLVLLDQQMPRMSGSQAARAIRELPGPACRTRLVALSASLSTEDEEELRACGVTEALRKPVRGEDLRRVVDGEGEARELVR